VSETGRVAWRGVAASENLTTAAALLLLLFPSFFFGAAPATAMATFELYRRSTIGMCLTETLDEMVSSGTLSPELAIQVLVQFDKVLDRCSFPFLP
jgi:hypothetical protein